MKKGMVIIWGCFLYGLTIHAQDAGFSVKVSSDSVLLGNHIIARFTLENADGGDFQGPAFEGFDIISGPNLSSSFSMINGKSSRSISYTYYLMPRDIGNLYIDPAIIDTGTGILETEPVPVIVLPNPDGIKEETQLPEVPFHLRFDGIDGLEEFNGFDLFERFKDLNGFDLFEDGQNGLDLQKLLPPIQRDSIPEPAVPGKKKRKTYKI